MLHGAWWVTLNSLDFFQFFSKNSLQISHLEFDVLDKHLEWLDEYWIIERDPEDQDKVRLQNFS